MNKTRYALLGLLAERPYSGYELKHVVELRFPLFWKESYGQIYPELKRMAAEGLVNAETEGPRGKTTYAITGEGQTSLEVWVAGEADEDQVRSEVLLKLYFSAFATPEVRNRHLTTVLDRARRQVAWLKMAEAQLLGILDDDATHRPALSIVRLGLATQAAQAEWAEGELAARASGKGGRG